MYRKPHLELYGTFRELTQLGTSGTPDTITILGIGNTTSPGNNVCQHQIVDPITHTFTCVSH